MPGTCGLVGLGILAPWGGTSLGIEVLSVGGWLTHGDYALDTAADFLVACEHRLILARVRSEWA